MRRKHMMIGLLAGTAMRLTAAEQRAGRFLRSPDGHDGGAAPAPAAPAPADPYEAPEAPGTVDDAYDKEFGGVVLPGEGDDDGDAGGGEDPAPEKPGVSEPEQKDDKDPAAELEAERQRANRLEEELREAKKGKEPAKDDAKPAAPEESDPAPKPDDYEFGEADSKYIAEFARWNARQEFKAEREREQIATELNTIEDGWNTAVASEDITAEYPDFADVVTKGAAEEKWDCTPLMALGIKSSPVGPHIAYELAKNPAEATRIANLPSVEQAWELGQLAGKHAARVAGKKAEAEAPAPTKVASSAPPPPAHRSRGSGGQSNDMSSTYDRMIKEFN